jgi:hypothetical protein
MKKFLICSVFLVSMGNLIAQIKITETTGSAPVDVLNNFYFKGGSLNGKYKLSLEKVMVNELFDFQLISYYEDNKWRLIKEFTGISKNLFYYTSPKSDFNYNNTEYNRVPIFIPQIFDKSELNILKGSNNIASLKNIREFLYDGSKNLVSINTLFVPSTFDEIYKNSPTIEILRDKLVEITDYKGLNDFYLLNTNSELNNLGTKTVQLLLANEKVKSEKEQSNNDIELSLDENDYLWRLFNVNNEIYLILSFRDVRELNISFPSFLDFIKKYGEFENNSDWFVDNWKLVHFTSGSLYMSPKKINITNKIFLDPKLCLFFFKLKAIN